MKNLFSLIVLSFFIIITACSQEQKESIVKIKTSLGDIKVKLYNETPQHRDNFIKLAKEGYFDGTLFHRVINDFMIQGGDPNSKNAEPGAALGEGGPGYTIPAEFNYPKYYHKKGALAAARQGDNVNPEKKSSGSQFYIVQGEVFKDNDFVKIENRMRDGKRREIFNTLVSEYNDSLNMLQSQGKREELLALQQRIMAMVNEKYSQEPEFTIPKDVKDSYKTIGGTPHLDNNYTVFGEIINEKNWIETVKSWFGKKYGFEVIDAIANVEKDNNNRPLKDIEMKIKVVRDFKRK